MQSILVGEDLNGCAFVYGSLSFLDKVSCGLALYILESYESKSCFLFICLTSNAYSKHECYSCGIPRDWAHS